MNTKTVVAFLISIALLSVAGCATKAIYNVSNAPVAPNKANPTVDEVRQSIIRAGAALGWQMKEVNPGHILGKLHLRPTWPRWMLPTTPRPTAHVTGQQRPQLRRHNHS